jgi:SAM-dependent methyltransferase
MGCGTGGHALTLARRGYAVAGLDRSSAMVRAAAAKAAGAGLTVNWQVGDITSARVDGTFDVVTIMFAVLGYLTDTNALVAALRNARSHLAAGGTLLFDVWYGPAVLIQRPTERVKVIEQDDGVIVRAAKPTLHAARDVVDVHTRVWRVVGDRVVFDATELHSVRYFFVPELDHLLGESSFRVERFFAFPDLESPPSTDAWSLGCVATAA